MPQPRRAPESEGPYHVTARGNRGQAIFVEDVDRDRFLGLLTRITSELSWNLFGYCLMTNHYHLVLETPHCNLSSGMQRLNATYAQWFNRRHALSGHLFRHRFYAGLVTSDSHLIELVRYLALNPVHAGLCGAPADWPWSSYRVLVSQEWSRPLSSRALAFFGPDHHRSRKTLRHFVEGGR